MARRDWIATAVMLVMAAAVIHESAKLPFGTIHNPGPGFVPWWAGVTLAGLSLLLGAQQVGARRPAGAGPAAERNWRGSLRVGGLLVALALYVVALEPLGYPVSTFLLVLVTLRPAEPRTIAPALALAALAAGGSYLLFAVWLDVPLPPGPFGS